jgi:hypothetical protein
MLEPMASPAHLRKLALSLPETEEKSHFGKADFRVKNKIFAGLTEVAGRGYVKARPELQALMVSVYGDVFSAATGAWGRSGWTYVELNGVDVGALRELVIDAWKLVAPAKLVAAYEDQQNSRAKVSARRVEKKAPAQKRKKRRARPS